MLMARPTGSNHQNSESHKLARAAVISLQNALAASRQHPDSPEVWRPARRQAVLALRAATQQHSLVLGLRAGAVYVADEAILTFHPGDRTFGRLRGAGIGELVLSRGLATERLEQLLQQLSAMSDSSDADGELTALIDAAHIPGIELHAAADLPTTGPAESCDWQSLPPPATTSPAVRAMIQRDGAANLPALAARQLLDDAERPLSQPCATALSQSECRRVLDRLMDRILRADDIATTTWLLTELERRPNYDAATRQSLLGKAQQHCSVTWLRDQLDRGSTDELLKLSALVMQLGDDFAERFALAAAAVAHPLSQWLGELLGHPTDANTNRPVGPSVAAPKAGPGGQP
jgi:hypothetical protein